MCLDFLYGFDYLCDLFFFQRDEDLDTSYEGLLALGSLLGDVKPRATASSVIELLPSAHYKDWKRPGCDTRCPICLDDVRIMIFLK